MAEKDNHGPGAEIERLCDDDLNAKIGVLTRREVEARILEPMIDALGAKFGRENVLAIVKDTIVKIASDHGAALRQHMGGNSLKHFAASLKYWCRDNALQIEVLEQTEDRFAFNVTRCRYAELYKKLGVAALGTTFSCARDFALIRGFNKKVQLKRTQTIMQGAAYCDFRYKLNRGE